MNPPRARHVLIPYEMVPLTACLTVNVQCFETCPGHAHNQTDFAACKSGKDDRQTDSGHLSSHEIADRPYATPARKRCEQFVTEQIPGRPLLKSKMGSSLNNINRSMRKGLHSSPGPPRAATRSTSVALLQSDSHLGTISHVLDLDARGKRDAATVAKFWTSSHPQHGYCSTQSVYGPMLIIHSVIAGTSNVRRAL